MFQPRYAPDGTVLAPRLTAPAADGHKYDRGHAFIFSGPQPFRTRLKNIFAY